MSSRTKLILLAAALAAFPLTAAALTTYQFSKLSDFLVKKQH